MPKTDKQLMLEAQRGKPIDQILLELLQKYRGRKSLAFLVGLELDATDATIYAWCERCGINIDDYKHPVASAS